MRVEVWCKKFYGYLAAIFCVYKNLKDRCGRRELIKDDIWETRQHISFLISNIQVGILNNVAGVYILQYTMIAGRGMAAWVKQR